MSLINITPFLFVYHYNKGNKIKCNQNYEFEGWGVLKYQENNVTMK